MGSSRRLGRKKKHTLSTGHAVITGKVTTHSYDRNINQTNGEKKQNTTGKPRLSPPMPPPETCASHLLPFSYLPPPLRSKITAVDAAVLGDWSGSAGTKVLVQLSVEDGVNEGLMKTAGITSPPVTAVKGCSPAESGGAGIAPLESIKAYKCWRGGGRI